MAKKVSDVMTSPAECIGEDDSIETIAKRLAELDVGALPICGPDDQVKGMVTDRDIVVKVIAQGGDATQVTAGSLSQGEPITIEADEPADSALALMSEHQVRRLPVVEDGRIAGIVSQADVATELSEKKVGETVEAISQDS
jgi:CBS domain-containing protein